MSINIGILFILTFAAGISVFFVPNIQNRNFRNVLSFSGAYLFSITVIHILPELFKEAEQPAIAGMFVLAGFYFQILLNFLTTGVEHGHIHHHHHAKDYSGAILLFVSLWLHSLLEGSLLVHPHANHEEGDIRNLLFGLLLHKVPESIALISVLLFQIKNKPIVFVLLLIYAASSPIGLLVSDFISSGDFYSSSMFTYLFAVVAGNFLHISTTIFFETEQPGHTFRGSKLLITGLAGLIAVLVEYFL